MSPQVNNWMIARHTHLLSILYFM